MNMYRIAGFEVHVLRLRLYTAMYVNTNILWYCFIYVTLYMYMFVIYYMIWLFFNNDIFVTLKNKDDVWVLSQIYYSQVFYV